MSHDNDAALVMKHAQYDLIVLTLLFVEKTPYGKFSIGKSQSDEYSMKDFMMAAATIGGLV